MVRPMLVLRSFAFFLVLAVAALALSGCGTPWRVLSQANPNPIGARSKLTVQKMTFENLQVGEKSDKQYAGEKEDKTAAAWEGDKAEMAQAFARAFIEAQEPLQSGDNGDFVVQINCTFIEPGFYAYVASAPAEIHVRVRVVDRAGTLVDEIEIRTASSDMAKRTRLRHAADAAGAALAKYLKKRVGL